MKPRDAGKLTQNELMETLYYNRRTGVFRWRIPRSGNKVRSKAGGATHDGYRTITLYGNRFREHRLAWLYVYGYFPENEIDHINRDKSDNRIRNLRVVSHVCNIRNRKTMKNNKSGITGVCWDTHNNRWKASIKAHGNVLNLGGYKKKIDAAKARWDAEVKYGFPNCNTTSSAFQFIESFK